MTAKRGTTPIFITPAAISPGRFGNRRCRINPAITLLVVRATDGEGDVQEWEEDRSPFSGVTGFHKIVVHITA